MARPTPPSDEGLSELKREEDRAWFAGLRGDENPSPSDDYDLGNRIRDVVLDDFTHSVREISVTELLSVWQAVEDELRNQEKSEEIGWLRKIKSMLAVSNWPTPQILVPGVVGMVAGLLLAPLMLNNLVSPSLPSGQPQLILTLGGYQEARGDITEQTVSLSVEDPVEASSVLVEDLLAMKIGVKIFRLPDLFEQHVLFDSSQVPEDRRENLLGRLKKINFRTGVTRVRYTKEQP